MTSAPWLVIGLGNPGPTYVATRHNVGFLVVDTLADRAAAPFRTHRGTSDVATIRVGSERAVLVKPRSFMNLSGGPAAGVRAYFKVPLDQVVVVHDELDLPFGSLRLKRGGGDNGHNGLRSITQSLGGPDYLRVRFGIGRPPGRMDPATFVLKDFSATEQQEIDTLLDRTADAVESLMVNGLGSSQNQFNR